ncbi:hypothetical protein MKX08_010184 [Trichoderma sp. CBMAI-0020]|nr:hypothetical protein MKX08_010184 [Trichoderma sp. CBMAI-0020]
MLENLNKSKDETMEPDYNVTEDGNVSEPNTGSGAHKFGLVQESLPELWQEYDVVVVHGIHKTHWTDDAWQPGSGAKSSASWIRDSLGLGSGRISHFHYQIDNAPSNALFVEGNEREAQNLLDGLVQMRLEFQEYSQRRGYGGVKLDMRPIIFVTHDIGSLIVKKALTLATRHPAKYGDIPYCTSNLIFLGCLRRGTRSTIEDPIARLLLLPGGSPQVHLLDSIQALTRTVQQVNSEFLDTKLLTRASIYNVFNDDILAQSNIAIKRGNVRTPMPFDPHNCRLDTSFELVQKTAITHRNLVNGDKSTSDDNSNDAQAIHDNLATPFHIKFKARISQLHKILLSLAPPIVPPNPDAFGWQLNELADRVMGSDQYKLWNSQPAMGVLHVKASLNTRLISEKLFSQLLDEHVSRNVYFFAFRRNDGRFNTAGNIDATSEKKFKFIFTTANEVDKSLQDIASSWVTMETEDPEEGGVRIWGSTMESIYGAELSRLTKKKPRYRFFLEDIREILTDCGDNHQLGLVMVDWLANYGPSGSQSGIRQTLESLSSATPRAVIDTVVISFGNREKRAREMLSWIKYTFESPTMRELAIAMRLEDGVGDEDVHDIDFDEVRGDILKFGLAFSFSEYEVDFSHAMYPHEEAKPERQATAHARIASLCLRYLSFPSVREQMRKMCERYASATPVSRPRQDLISYAVSYWPKHYKSAGTKKPTTAANAFFQDPETREAWAQPRYVLSNPVTRLERHHLSPLPFIAMAGLDDLLTAQIEDERELATFSTNTGLALIEAASNGHGHMVRLLAEANKPNKKILAEALMMAATVGDEDILNYLIKEAAKFESFDWPSILFPRVAWLGLCRTVELLLEAGANIPQSGHLFEESTPQIAAKTRNSGATKDFCHLHLGYECFPQSSIFHPGHSFELDAAEFESGEEESESEDSDGGGVRLSPEAYEDEFDEDGLDEDSDDSS